MDQKFLVVLVFSVLVFTPVSAESNTSSFYEFASNLPDSIQIVGGNETVENPEDQEPLGGTAFWVIFLTLLTAAVVVYSFEVDPVYLLGFIVLFILVVVFVLRGFVSV